jgi:cell division protease FtsH
MSDQNDPSNRPAGGDPKGSRPGEARGPKVPRGVPWVVLVLLLLLVMLSLLSYSKRIVREITFADFQTFWEPSLLGTGGRFVGFTEAELTDEFLYVRPIDEEWARELVNDPRKAVNRNEMKIPPTPAPSLEATAKSTNGKTPSGDALAKREPKAADPKSTDQPSVQSAPVKVPADTAEAEGLFSFKKEFWLKLKVPARAIDGDFIKRLGTIPKFRYEPTSQLVPALLVPFFYLLLLGALLWLAMSYLVRSQAGPGNVLAFGRSRTRSFVKENTRIRFTDVAGIDEAKEEVVEVIEFLKDPKRFERLGGRIPRGILFVGPPGTGKTLLAKAIAGEAGVPFFGISGSDFVEMFVGVGASRVRDLFRQARESSPCIIFLDEIDAVGRRRGGGHGNSHEEREQTLNAILVEMDGFESNDQVIVIAATNRPDVLDPALMRPGRFDREVVISLPDVRGRNEILRVHSRRVKLSDAVDLNRIARGTPMFSGAQLMSLVNEAAIRATMLGKEFVEQDDLEEARDKVWFGRQRRSRELDEQDRRMTAWHEAGHAILSFYTAGADPLHKVTIIPRGMALGLSMSLPLKDQVTLSKDQALAQIRVAMGGRIAEEMVFGQYNSGARSDIEKATGLARRMVCEFGMSDELGPVRYAVNEGSEFLGSEIALSREYSEETARRIDGEVRRIIDECYARAKAEIESHRADLDLLAQALLKHETLTVEEVRLLLDTRDMDAIVKPEPPVAETSTEAPIETG